MSFTLLSELLVVKEEQAIQEVYPILESVETLLRNLTAKIKNRPENFLEHIEVEQLAPQLAALMLLGKAENREGFADFEPSEEVDGKKVSQKFYQFLRDIDEQHSDKLFSEGGEKMTANKFLHYIGTTNAKSLSEEWKKTLEDAKAGDQEAVKRVSNAFTKLNEFYAIVYKKLTDAFYDKQGEHAFGQKTSNIDSAMSGLNVEI